MAILISCLELFGLTAFSAEQRSKEIGVRKVLGACVTGIVQLLSKDFLKLVDRSLNKYTNYFNENQYHKAFQLIM
jgi:ABC-type antimicrobial peptide transport system permease subunit